MARHRAEFAWGAACFGLAALALSAAIRAVIDDAKAPSRLFVVAVSVVVSLASSAVGVCAIARTRDQRRGWRVWCEQLDVLLYAEWNGASWETIGFDMIGEDWSLDDLEVDDTWARASAAARARKAQILERIKSAPATRGLRGATKPSRSGRDAGVWILWGYMILVYGWFAAILGLVFWALSVSEWVVRRRITRGVRRPASARSGSIGQVFDRWPAVVCAMFLAVLSTAQERWRVRCLDRAGKPVASAELHVWQRQGVSVGGVDYVQAGPFTTDAEGFADTAPELTYDGGQCMRFAYARVPGRLVGTLRMMRGDFGDVGDAEVLMHPSRSIRGRLSVPDGADPTGVLVKVVDLVGFNGSFPRSYFPRNNILRALDSMSDRFECRVRADGTFVLHDMPQQSRLTLTTRASGFAHQQWSNRSPESGASIEPHLLLEPEAVLGGRVVGLRGAPASAAVVTLTLLDGTARYRWRSESRVGADGRFRLRGLAAGNYLVSVSARKGVFRPVRRRIATDADPEELELELVEAVEVGGVIADSEERPIGDAMIAAVTSGEGEDGDHLASVRSDPQGRFVLRLPPGAARLYVAALPVKYARGDGTRQVDLQVAPDADSLRELRFVAERR